MKMMVQAQKPLSRREEIESLIRRFPDVPPEVIVKEDLLTHGVRFSEAALRAGESSQVPTVGTFLWESIRPEEIEQKAGGRRRIPQHIELHGGLEESSRATPGASQARRSERSTGGKAFLRKGGQGPTGVSGARTQRGASGLGLSLRAQGPHGSGQGFYGHKPY